MIVDKGEASVRFNVALLAEGFRQSELPLFAQYARAFADTFARTPPFTENCRAVNVFRIDVASRDSGADDPAVCGGSGVRVDTYFDATYCGTGVRRALVVNDATALDVVNAQVPEWDIALVIVNSGIHGGTGGTVGVTAVAPSWEQTAIHEMGHSAFGLADEYEYWAGCGIDTDRNYYPYSEPAAPNVTIARSGFKWDGLVLGSTPVPTTVNANCSQCDPQPNPYPGRTVVGLYEGAHYYHCGSYRPAFDCMMRNLTPFCPVCGEQIERTLSQYDRAPRCDAGDFYVAECTGAATRVQLDGSGSSSLGCGKLTYAWSGAFLEGTATGAKPAVTFAGPNSYLVYLDVSAGPRPWDRGDCSASVHVVDSLAPLVQAPPDVDACGFTPDIGTAIGTDSCDPAVALTNDAPAVFPLGDTVVTWTGTDDTGHTGTATQRVTLHERTDTTPPELRVSLSPSVLWPPSQKLVGIKAHIVARDLCDSRPTVRLVSILSNEPEGRGGKRVSPDIVGATPGTDDRGFFLRARRDLTGSGRVYTATYEVVDDSGHVTTGQATVSVPRSRVR
jgi:hypothetical protein